MTAARYAQPQLSMVDSLGMPELDLVELYLAELRALTPEGWLFLVALTLESCPTYEPLREFGALLEELLEMAPPRARA
jgi:hypothetical protein